MRKFIVAIALMINFVCLAYGQTELKHELSTGSSKTGNNKEQLTEGTIDMSKTINLNMPDKTIKNVEYHDNIIAGGHDLRVYEANKNFLDISAFFGINPLNYKFFNSGNNMNYGLISDNYFISSYFLFSLSLDMMYNYKICNGLYLGLGIDPTLYKKDRRIYKFDVPITTKLSYNFHGAELSIMYKHGFRELMNVDNKSVKIRNVQTKVVVPF